MNFKKLLVVGFMPFMLLSDNSAFISGGAILTQNRVETPLISSFTHKEDPLIAWLEDLAYCESRNNENAINWDDGGSPSFGLFQWKEDSFWRYNLKYGIIPDLERREVRNIIMDVHAQAELTKKVLEEPGGWRNWFNCLKDSNGV